MSQTAAFPQAYPAQFQPAYAQAASPGQQFPTPQVQPGPYYVQPGQPSQAMGQQAQPGRRPNRRRPTPPPTTAYWKSAFIADKLVEFVSNFSFASKAKLGHALLINKKYHKYTQKYGTDKLSNSSKLRCLHGQFPPN